MQLQLFLCWVGYLRGILEQQRQGSPPIWSGSTQSAQSPPTHQNLQSDWMDAHITHTFLHTCIYNYYNYYYYYLNAISIIQKQIIWFNISVNHMLRMHCRYGQTKKMNTQVHESA